MRLAQILWIGEIMSVIQEVVVKDDGTKHLGNMFESDSPEGKALKKSGNYREVKEFMTPEQIEQEAHKAVLKARAEGVAAAEDIASPTKRKAETSIDNAPEGGVVVDLTEGE